MILFIRALLFKVLMVYFGMALCKKCKVNKKKNETNNDEEHVLSCTVDSEGKHHSFKDRPSMRIRSDCGEWTGKRWHKHGYLHRLTGPARIDSDDYEEYFINGHEYSKSEWQNIKNKK